MNKNVPLHRLRTGIMIIMDIIIKCEEGAEERTFDCN
jgi:hypothetical protein